MSRVIRNIIVVAMGAGALGGPDALRLLLAFAGKSPLVDILIAVFVIAAVTAPALGTMLLARFFRKPRAVPGAARAGRGAAGAAVADDPFAQMTLVVSLAVAFLVSASLLVLPLFQSGHLVPLAFAGVALVVGACASRVRGVLLPNVHGGAGAAATPAATATERGIKPTLSVSLAAICLVLVAPWRLAVGILDAPSQRLLAPLATVPVVGVAAATVVGTTILVLRFRKAKHAAATPDAATTPATERSHKMVMVTALAVAFFLPVPLVVVVDACPRRVFGCAC
uniref:Uncharacterized protein n=1 Tax=Oryza rufipogon TaxID=4529 RepID=A0A0E0PUS0_ORYRU